MADTIENICTSVDDKDIDAWLERNKHMTWVIEAEISYQGRQASTTFEIEADTMEEALHHAQAQLERDGATVFTIDAKMLEQQMHAKSYEEIEEEIQELNEEQEM